MNIYIPKDVEYIINKFYENGYEAFMVGGCVRDSLLGKTPTDYDITTSAPPNITQKLFNKTIPTGIKHGTITVIINNNSYEVTTYRTEENYIDNRRPDKVNFVTNIKEDLSRRDFSINAFAYNNKEGLLDFFNGQTDLNNKLIKCVGDANTRFNEDALRMLRAIRFSSQLDFDIDKKTYLSIKDNYKLISNISKERIRDEFIKMLLCNNPAKGLNYLIETNIYSIIFENVSEPNNFNNISYLPKDICIRTTALLKDNNPDKVKVLLKNLRFTNNEINTIYIFISNYNLLGNHLSKIEIKNIIATVGKEKIISLINMYETLEETSLDNLKHTVNLIISNDEALYIKDLNIDGSILKDNFEIKSGKIIGDTLNYLLKLVMDETIDNDTSLLIKEADRYIKNKVY